ncbi:MAG TPA: hypothetical protein VF707_13350 [Ardenticatenaceae bacterium]|jgi:hypothetical protein
MREYKASKLRYILLFTLFMVIGAAIARIIIYRFIGEAEPSLFTSFIGTFVGHILGIPLLAWMMAPVIERLNITITDDAISGPPPRAGKRVTIPFEKIDWGKSKRPNPFQRLFGNLYIHSVDGEIIVLSGLSFDRATMKKILEQIEAGTNEPRPPVS